MAQRSSSRSGRSRSPQRVRRRTGRSSRSPRPRRQRGAYSQELGMLCDAAAEDTPRPPCPSQCGRCGKGSTMINDGQVVATFARRVYRMEGCAGHTYFVCRYCSCRFTPNQPGPSAEWVRRIEQQRERDLVKRRAADMDRREARENRAREGRRKAEGQRTKLLEQIEKKKKQIDTLNKKLGVVAVPALGRGPVESINGFSGIATPSSSQSTTRTSGVLGDVDTPSTSQSTTQASGVLGDVDTPNGSRCTPRRNATRAVVYTTPGSSASRIEGLEDVTWESGGSSRRARYAQDSQGAEDEVTLLERDSERSIAEVACELALDDYPTTIEEEERDLTLALRMSARSRDMALLGENEAGPSRLRPLPSLNLTSVSEDEDVSFRHQPQPQPQRAEILQAIRDYKAQFQAGEEEPAETSVQNKGKGKAAEADVHHSETQGEPGLVEPGLLQEGDPSTNGSLSEAGSLKIKRECENSVGATGGLALDDVIEIESDDPSVIELSSDSVLSASAQDRRRAMRALHQVIIVWWAEPCVWDKGPLRPQLFEITSRLPVQLSLRPSLLTTMGLTLSDTVDVWLWRGSGWTSTPVNHALNTDEDSLILLRRTGWVTFCPWFHHFAFSVQEDCVLPDGMGNPVIIIED